VTTNDVLKITRC